MIKIVLLTLTIALFFVPTLEIKYAITGHGIDAYGEQYDIIETTFVSLFEVTTGNLHPFGNQLHLILMPALALLMIVLELIKKTPKKLMLALSIMGLLYSTVTTLLIGHALAFRPYIFNRTSQIAIWFLVGAWIILTLNLLAGQKQKTENIDPPYSKTQKMVISSIILALGVITAVAMRPLNIPIAGVQILNISFAGFFHNITAIFFGPFFGGVARGLSDIISFMISPRPPFLIALTLTAVLRGALIGYLWQKLRNITPTKFAIFYSAGFIILLIIGSLNTIMWNMFPHSGFTNSTLPPTEAATIALSYGFLIAGLLGIIVQSLIYFLAKKMENKTFYNRFLKLFIVLVFPGILVNAINTYILFVSVIGSGTVGLGIMYFFVPRFFNELIVSTLSVFVMVFVMSLYELTIRRKIVQSE
ncbi:MAG: ECF transporter S component [Defluviitaleaceae bacterium]|nr:ECF transporter S component [Defluviitaleaceae bacterium]